MSNQRWINELSNDEIKLALYAALTPNRISIDMLIAATAFSAIKILSFLENLTQKGILDKHQSQTLGMYRFIDSRTADKVLEIAKKKT